MTATYKGQIDNMALGDMPPFAQILVKAIELSPVGPRGIVNMGEVLSIIIELSQSNVLTSEAAVQAREAGEWIIDRIKNGR